MVQVVDASGLRRPRLLEELPVEHPGATVDPERVVDAAKGDLGPVSIVRPAVVESAMVYPFPGWNQGINTSAPLVWMTSQGTRYWPTTDTISLDVVPVDYVVSVVVGQ